MEGVARDDAMTPQMGLRGGANLTEEDAGDDSMTPRIGMEFPTHDDAYEFYNMYALKTGFGVRRSSTGVSRTDKNKVISRKFVCCKEGKPNSSNIEGAAQVVHNRQLQLRVGCNARMNIILTNSNTWKVSVFVEQHDNHGLTTPSKTSKHRSHKNVHRKPVVKKLITQLHNQGIKNSEIARVVNALEPSQHDIVTPQQVHDHLRIERKKNIGQNCDRHRRVTVDLRDSAPMEVDHGLIWRIRYKLDKLLEEAYKSPTFAEEFDTLLSKMLGEVDNRKNSTQQVEFDASSQSQVGSTTVSQNIDLFPKITIRDPPGCDKTKRQLRTSTIIQNGLKVSQEESRKKQRTCGFCGGKGHYKTGCAKAKEVSQKESHKKQRTCGFCGEKGHYKTGCAKAKKEAFATYASAAAYDHQFL